MTEIIFEYRWLILISSEILFWCTFILFLVLRYLYNSGAQNFFLVISIINQFLNIPLAAFDYYQIRHVSMFQISILLLYIYAITRGRRDIYKLDKLILRNVASIKNNSFRSTVRSPLEHLLSGDIHAKIERRKFYLHLIVYFLAQIFVFSGHQSYQPINQFWTVFIIIDGLWSLSFTFFQYDKNAN
ncbi:hypothetical protein [Aquibacillus saliphilus]|uniref:hypothetical protein n=1 Tax=Aquibacillus saliphilus TaxID=1909422 RepID=UPI001CF03D66|nr:hypothetical protein [Aquibacillus saliphilus]